MKNYDKIILDMFNVYHRIVIPVDASDPVQSKVETMVEYINNLTMTTYGDIYVLFDPLTVGKGLSKRQNILKEYKSNRKEKLSPTEKTQQKNKREALAKLYGYLIIKGNPRIHVYMHEEYEADDYVEKLTETGRCLLVTTDMDWARYLENDRVVILKEGLSPNSDKVFTIEHFIKKFGFTPTISSVTFYKAIYHSDPSDCITGAFHNKKVIVIQEASDEMMRLIKWMGETNQPLDLMKTRFVQGIEEFLELSNLIKLSCSDKAYEKILTLAENNFKVIESFLPRKSKTKIEDLEVKFEKPKIAVTSKFTLNSRR